MRSKSAFASTFVVVAILASACGGGGRSASDAKPDVGPRAVVVKFYADAADLNCQGAIRSAVFRGGKKQERQFVDECETAKDISWAQDVEIGEPKPASESELDEVKSVWTNATDLVSIPVAEGTSPNSPHDAYVVKRDGSWRLVMGTP